MAVTTTVFVVCSPLDRVGKTLVARLLAEFLMADGRYVDAFDVNPERPLLTECLPGCTTPVDLSNMRRRTALFDRLMLEDAVPKVIDLGHAAFEPFFKTIGQIGFVLDPRRSTVQLVTLFVTHPGPVAVRSYAALQRWFSGVVLVPVQNDGLVRSHDDSRFPCAGGASLPLRIPALATGLQRIVADPAFSFARFHHGQGCPIVEPYRHELHSWLTRIFMEFRELDLRLLLETLSRSSSQAAATNELGATPLWRG